MKTCTDQERRFLDFIIDKSQHISSGETEHLFKMMNEIRLKRDEEKGNNKMSLDGGLNVYSSNFDKEERINNKTCKGRHVYFLNKNGYIAELEEARKYFNKGVMYYIEEIEVGRSSSRVKFNGINRWFNTTMFSDVLQ